MQETQGRQVQSLGQEDPLEEGMANPHLYSCLDNPQSHGQRSLVAYSPRGCKESDMTEHMQQKLTQDCQAAPYMLSHTALSDSLQPHRLQPTSLLCPWNFPGRSNSTPIKNEISRSSMSQGLNQKTDLLPVTLTEMLI